jgi:hypothetical protein
MHEHKLPTFLLLDPHPRHIRGLSHLRAQGELLIALHGHLGGDLLKQATKPGFSRCHRRGRGGGGGLLVEDNGAAIFFVFHCFNAFI